MEPILVSLEKNKGAKECVDLLGHYVNGWQYTHLWYGWYGKW